MMCAIARNDFAAAREVFFNMAPDARDAPMSRFLMYKIAIRSDDVGLGERTLFVAASIYFLFRRFLRWS
jgi:hypothetical protein